MKTKIQAFGDVDNTVGLDEDAQNNTSTNNTIYTLFRFRFGLLSTETPPRFVHTIFPLARSFEVNYLADPDIAPLAVASPSVNRPFCTIGPQTPPQPPSGRVI